MDGIFTQEELQSLQQTETEAQQPQEGQHQEQQQEQQVEDGSLDNRPRNPDGTFAPKEKAEGEEGKPPEGHVPQGALHAERERRKGAEAELKKVQEQLQAIAKMREQVNARTAQQIQPVEGEDPNGVEHLKRKVAEIAQAQTRVGQTLDHQAIEAHRQSTIHAALSSSEARFRQDHADYDNAIRHLVNARAQELALYGLSQIDVRNALATEVQEITEAAIAQGKDPAEVGYELARLRGYRAETQGSGKAAAQVDAVANAQAQSRSLGQSAGSTPKQLTAEAILAMSPEEFEALYSTPDGKAMIDSL